jgi:anti-sigma-K factor RskA
MSNADQGEMSALAAEYVLGFLQGADRVMVENHIASDPAFAREVRRWQSHLGELDQMAKSVALPDALWPRLEKSLGVATIQQQARIENVSIFTRLSTLWENLPFWRSAGLTAAIACLALAIGLGAAVQEARKTPTLVAILVTDGNQPAAVVNAFSDGRTELISLDAFVVPEGKALEIWTLWDRAVGPRSVGLIGKSQSTRLRLDKLPLGKGQLFEITLEPSTGSPTGRPTGPILAKGLTTQAL